MQKGMNIKDRCYRCVKNKAEEGSHYCRSCKENFQLEDNLNKTSVEKQEIIKERLEKLLNSYRVEKVQLQNDLENSKALVNQHMLRLEHISKAIKELEELR